MDEHAITTEDGLGEPTKVKRGSRRDKIRRSPGLGQLYRVGVFVLGLAFIGLGAGLVVLPGPLTIPPILIGLWIWSTEFAWADRFFDSFKDKGREAWDHAKEHPVTSALVTIGGIVAAGTAIWLVRRYELVDRAMAAVGLN